MARAKTTQWLHCNWIRSHWTDNEDESDHLHVSLLIRLQGKTIKIYWLFWLMIHYILLGQMEHLDHHFCKTYGLLKTNEKNEPDFEAICGRVKRRKNLNQFLFSSNCKGFKRCTSICIRVQQAIFGRSINLLLYQAFFMWTGNLIHSCEHFIYEIVLHLGFHMCDGWVIIRRRASGVCKRWIQVTIDSIVWVLIFRPGWYDVVCVCLHTCGIWGFIVLRECFV